MRFLKPILISICVIPSTISLAQDAPVWKSWGGNLENTHQAINSPLISPENVGNLKVKWTFETKGDVSAIPVVSEQHVYFPDWGLPYVAPVAGGSYLYALNREDGSPVWNWRLKDHSNNPLNSLARTSFAIEGDYLIVGDNRNVVDSLLSVPGAKGATIYALNRHTGTLIWSQTLDPHPLAIVTQAPVVANGRIYVGTSSNEEASARITKDCCTFRGSMLSLDLATGKILWQTYMTPQSEEKEDGYTGNAVWGSQPAVDLERDVVYIATGNNYTFPKALEDCIKEYRGDVEGQQRECYAKLDSPENYANSVLALDLDNGSVRWVQKMLNTGAWAYACDPSLAPGIPARPENCEDIDSLDLDFGQAPMLIRGKANGGRDLVAVGQKSGVFYAFDADKNGEMVWASSVGPGGTLGGMEFGSATDGTRIYAEVTNNAHTPYILQAGLQKGMEVNGRLWAALDAQTGKLLWQTPDPASFEPLKGLMYHPVHGAGLGKGFFGLAKGPLTIANNVLFGGSMDKEGHMYAFDARDGRILWSFASGGSVMSAPAIVDNVVYWGSGYFKTGFANNKFYAFSLQ